MATADKLERVLFLLEKNSKEQLLSFFDDHLKELNTCRFLKTGEHFPLSVTESLPRCFSSELYIPKHISGKYIALR